MEVSGHVPQDVSLREAIEGGMRTPEHFIGALASVMRDETLPSPDLSVFDERALDLVRRVGSGEIDASELIDQEKLDAFAAYVATQDHWFMPTHDIMRNFTNDYQRPLEDLAALSHIQGVMTEGDWHDRAALDAMLAQLERRASGED